MVSRNSRVPPEVSQWLGNRPLAFPIDWTLDHVAEECHRRWLGGHVRTQVEAANQVADWALAKLVENRFFSRGHWDWIVATDDFGGRGIPVRIGEIVRPAVAVSDLWRSAPSEQQQRLAEIDAAAKLLLNACADPNLNLRISLPEVCGQFPEMRPLLDCSSRLISDRMDEIREARIKAEQTGKPIDLKRPIFGSYRPPTLQDYLVALRAELAGTGKSMLPSAAAFRFNDDEGESELEGDSESAELEYEEDFEEAVRIAGEMMTGRREDADEASRLVSAGGAFGSYPKRADALRRAIIAGMPRAIFNRYEAPPSVTPATFIEQCCISWFGSSPDKKDINKAIRGEREGLERAMQRKINQAAKQAAMRAEWDALGLSPEERRKRVFQAFLDEEGGESREK